MIKLADPKDIHACIYSKVHPPGTHRWKDAPGAAEHSHGAAEHTHGEEGSDDTDNNEEVEEGALSNEEINEGAEMPCDDVNADTDDGTGDDE